MALRDKLAERVDEHLDPGEELRQVFLAQSGPSPYWGFLTWLTLFWNTYLIVAVTDRSIVTLKATAFRPTFVKKPAQVTRYGRDMEFGSCSGLWSKVQVAGETFHVHRRFHKDIGSADADREQVVARLATGVAPAGWYADPEGGAGMRYWDGSVWTDHRS